jgi:hypothetical protein
MSNSLAITAVSLTLQSLLDREFNAPVRLLPDPEVVGTRISVRPPDKARDGFNGNQINLFLFQTALNGALRNMDMPFQTKPGERGQPPLALNLSYMLTAYGKDSQDLDLFSHRLLGRAMSVLHDNPILSPAQIRAATEVNLPDSDLHEQIEHVRITHASLSVEELSRLWSTFQTQYRISTIYYVAVVLVESTRRAKAALPVLKRGPDDSGAAVQADPTPPFPTLEGIFRLRRQPGIRLADTLIVRGHHLDGLNQAIRFRSLRLDLLNEVAPEAGGSASELTVKLPDPALDVAVAQTWPAGMHAVALSVERGGKLQSSNELPIALVPQISIPDDALREADGKTFLKITCVPQVWREQRVALLLNDREVLSAPREENTDTLEFEITGTPAGTYIARLRVDGVDSVPFVEIADPPGFEFSANQKVTIP